MRFKCGGFRSVFSKTDGGPDPNQQYCKARHMLMSSFSLRSLQKISSQAIKPMNWRVLKMCNGTKEQWVQNINGRPVAQKNWEGIKNDQR
jgi:hypothetical protein